MKKVICKSGITGWQSKIHKVYDSFDEFNFYDDVYNIARRLGYSSAERAWKKNPVIQGSVNADDLCKVKA